MLYHVSEERGLTLFEPRPNPSFPVPVVWAIDREHLRNYMLPRDCPRVTFYASARSTQADIDRYLGASKSVVAFEEVWLERIRSSSLVCYHLPEETFESSDPIAGYFVSRRPVAPCGIEIIENPLAKLEAEGVEVRVLQSLWELRDAIVASTLEFSIIRMRNAQPRL